MFLSLLTLMQTNLPCSVNYYRYKNNYEKYVGEDNKEEAKKPEVKKAEPKEKIA